MNLSTLEWEVALEKIRSLKKEGAVEALVDNLSSYWDKYVKEALIEIGKPAVEPLIKALDDKSCRCRAVYVLGEIGDERAVQPLGKILEGGRDDWKFDTTLQTVIDALGKIILKTENEQAVALLANAPTPNKVMKEIALYKVHGIAVENEKVKETLQRCKALQELAGLGGLS